MKYKIFFGSTILGLLLGSGLMYFLLSDEGKWGNPKFMPVLRRHGHYGRDGRGHRGFGDKDLSPRQKTQQRGTDRPYRRLTLGDDGAALDRCTRIGFGGGSGDEDKLRNHHLFCCLSRRTLHCGDRRRVRKIPESMISRRKHRPLCFG